MPTTTRAPRRWPVIQSRAEVARRTGRTRSTITEALSPGGALHSADVAGRVDCSHPAFIAWAVKRGIDPAIMLDLPTRAPLMMREVAPSVDEFAAQCGVTSAEVREALASHIIPQAHVSAEAFAYYAGMDPAEILAAVNAGELIAALTTDGRLDLEHRASLGFLARHPFAPDGSNIPDGFLTAAFVGRDDVDVNHPVARAFLARSWGRVPTDSDLTTPVKRRRRPAR